jgi:ubiquinone/menaquinone biosynthesis C-methylase UbiE
MAKDLFSGHAGLYARYRPGYPAELIEYILGFCNERNVAWDCATGNGQAAVILSEYFNEVDATDISAQQLANAVQKPNILYRVAPAESTPFADNRFDLITVATAYHWLNWEAFRAEVLRVGKPGSVIAAWAYNVIRAEDEAIDKIIQQFYWNIIGQYWDPERRYVDQAYATVDFNFTPLPSKEFSHHVLWDKQTFKGYLHTWSAVQKYIRENNQSPVTFIDDEVDSVWKENEPKAFHFPLFLRIGRIEK